MLFWWSRLVTASAFHVVTVAVGWQVYHLSGSLMDLGLVGLFEFLPRILFLLHAGAAADRFQRRRVALFTRTVQGTTALVLAWGAVSGWLGREGIFALVAVFGAARAFEMPSTQALLPQLVPASQLGRALATTASSLQAATIAAPALAGFLFALGAAWVFALSGALYLAAALMTLGLPAISPPPADASLAGRWENLFAGIHYICRRPHLFGAISLDLFAVLLGGATALLPAIAKDVLHTGPWGLGILRSAPAVGALAVSLWLARHPPRRKVGRMMFAASALFGVTTILFGLSTSLWPAFLSLAVMGGADMVSVVIRMSLLQLETPDAMRGRVSAVSSLFIGASNQLGEFESGLTAAWFGLVPAVVLGGVGTLAVTGLWMRWFPSLARRDAMVGGGPAPAAAPPGLRGRRRGAVRSGS